MNIDDKNVIRGADPTLDAVISNFVDILPVSTCSDYVQKICHAVRKLMPYSDMQYVSYQVTKLFNNGGNNLRTLNSGGNVKNYAHSLLHSSNKCNYKSEFDSSKSFHQKNNVQSFKSKNVGSLLSNHPKKEDYREDSSPSMVIHVCDEAKNLKQDFNCPRDLLIKEMRYFAEYLSVDSQRLEEVDISVHCDIHIFDWLMRYVKRGTKLIDAKDVPKLDPNNVISILISSDFLKMGTLVEACIDYCHKNMSLIVATPCNMNCVNEKLTSLIAEKFNHNELEEVKDRKDKFKSKLFCKKIEKLFSNASNLDSPGRGGSLFKCSVCQKILLAELNSKVPCTNNRLSISCKGGLSYQHEIDNSWDVNSYLLLLYEELHKWNLVYWRLWGIINHLQCSRCGLTFQLCDFGSCLHHQDRPQYRLLSGGDTSENPIGVYPCCNQQVLRFDATGLNKGCRSKDHVVTTLNTEQQRVLDDFMSHKNLIKFSTSCSVSSGNLNVFASEELCCGIKEATTTPVKMYSSVSPIPSAASSTIEKKTKLKRNNFSSELDDEDEAGEDDVPIYKKLSVSDSSLFAIDTNRLQLSNKKKEKYHLPTDTTSYRKYPSKQRWDSARSVRFNQDIQREEDRRRMTTITSSLAKQRSIDKVERTKVKDSKELSGGIFMKLEMAFLNNIKGQSQIHTLSRHFGGKEFKSKHRR